MLPRATRRTLRASSGLKKVSATRRRRAGPCFSTASKVPDTFFNGLLVFGVWASNRPASEWWCVLPGPYEIACQFHGMSRDGFAPGRGTAALVSFKLREGVVSPRERFDSGVGQSAQSSFFVSRDGKTGQSRTRSGIPETEGLSSA